MNNLKVFIQQDTSETLETGYAFPLKTVPLHGHKNILWYST